MVTKALNEWSASLSRNIELKRVHVIRNTDLVPYGCPFKLLMRFPTDVPVEQLSPFFSATLDLVNENKVPSLPEAREPPGGASDDAWKAYAKRYWLPNEYFNAMHQAVKAHRSARITREQFKEAIGQICAWRLVSSDVEFLLPPLIDAGGAPWPGDRLVAFGVSWKVLASPSDFLEYASLPKFVHETERALSNVEEVCKVPIFSGHLEITPDGHRIVKYHEYDADQVYAFFCSDAAAKRIMDVIKAYKKQRAALDAHILAISDWCATLGNAPRSQSHATAAERYASGGFFGAAAAASPGEAGGGVEDETVMEEEPDKKPVA